MHAQFLELLSDDGRFICSIRVFNHGFEGDEVQIKVVQEGVHGSLSGAVLVHKDIHAAAVVACKLLELQVLGSLCLRVGVSFEVLGVHRYGTVIVVVGPLGSIVAIQAQRWSKVMLTVRFNLYIHFSLII